MLHNRDREGRIAREITSAQRAFAAGVPVLEVIDDFMRSDHNAARPWFITPVADGGHLGDKLILGRPFGGSFEAAMRAGAELIGAVHGLHGLSIAHRDLKPENVLISGESFLLGDLGLCLPLEELDGERLTGELERIGSIHFMPPEAFRRRPLDGNQFAFDAFAVGKLLYCLLAGRRLPAFESPVDPEFDLSRAENTPRIRALNRLMRGLLHDQPEARIAALATADEVLNDLIDSSGIVAGTPTSRTALAKAAEALAERVFVGAKAAVDPQDLEEARAVASEIVEVWRATSEFAEIKEVFVAKNASTLELRESYEGLVLREILHAAAAHTHAALEPLEDLGYPRRPAAEAGCALGVAPRGASSGLPTLWLGALVTVQGQSLQVGFATAASVVRGMTRTDIVTGSAVVVTGKLHDSALVGRIKIAAREGMATFTIHLAERFTGSS